MKQVCLIVPVYNAGAFLTPLVRSVLAQDYENFQLILSDDGSTDASPELMHSFAQEDSRITLVTGPNGGVSSARNRALLTAAGDYIGFLDADDQIAPNYLSTQIGTAFSGCCCDLMAIPPWYGTSCFAEKRSVSRTAAFSPLTNICTLWRTENSCSAVVLPTQYSRRSPCITTPFGPAAPCTESSPRGSAQS